MNQPSLTQRAQQGDSKAITEVLNYMLKSEDIVTQSSLKAQCLFVTLEGKTTPDQEQYVTYVQNFVNQLELNDLVTQIKVMGRRKGATFAAWSQEVKVKNTQQVTSHNPANQLVGQLVKTENNQVVSANSIETVTPFSPAQNTFDFTQLSEEQQIAFCGALFALAAADGSIDPQESSLILESIEIDSLPENTKRQLQSYLILPPPLDTCLDKLTTASTVVKQHLILYFLEIALVDETLTPEEAEAIKLAQRKLQLSDKQLNSLQSFVYKMKGVNSSEPGTLNDSSTVVVDLVEEGADIPDLLSIEDPNALAKNSSHYSDEKFTGKIKKIIKIGGKKVVYNALLLYLTSKHKNTPLGYKAIAIGALGYLIFPLDLVPDAIPGLGLGDDLTGMFTAIKTVSLAITPDIEQAAQRQVASWFGESI